MVLEAGSNPIETIKHPGEFDTMLKTVLYPKDFDSVSGWIPDVGDGIVLKEPVGNDADLDRVRVVARHTIERVARAAKSWIRKTKNGSDAKLEITNLQLFIPVITPSIEVETRIFNSLTKDIEIAFLRRNTIFKLNDNILCKTVHKWASRRKSSWDHRVLSIGRELHVLNDQSDAVCIDDVWDSLWEREVAVTGIAKTVLSKKAAAAKAAEERRHNLAIEKEARGTGVGETIGTIKQFGKRFGEETKKTVKQGLNKLVDSIDTGEVKHRDNGIFLKNIHTREGIFLSKYKGERVIFGTN
ncbi:hypothetical protein LOTGIDRAFT_153360 [Lottia gigantea]|uniref:Uncharacterized protein n=1 Tax=Lottia gigantea TaxID=225164 RepID=V3ZR57_LOTGI|nr:hypothetical protein LOTGIDRAFT_153360 [Lottia gigantea]ESO93888.1 hypothetical protein LOTGIDRAFT_153360 [Lottia gigantea]